MIPGRTLNPLTEISRCEALTILNATENNSSKEIRRNYTRLARKYHPDKWNSSYEFTKEVSESVFKNLANVYEVLKEKC